MGAAAPLVTSGLPAQPLPDCWPPRLSCHRPLLLRWPALAAPCDIARQWGRRRRGWQAWWGWRHLVGSSTLNTAGAEATTQSVLTLPGTRLLPAPYQGRAVRQSSPARQEAESVVTAGLLRRQRWQAPASGSPCLDTPLASALLRLHVHTPTLSASMGLSCCRRLCATFNPCVTAGGPAAGPAGCCAMVAGLGKCPVCEVGADGGMVRRYTCTAPAKHCSSRPQVGNRTPCFATGSPQ